MEIIFVDIYFDLSVLQFVCVHYREKSCVPRWIICEGLEFRHSLIFHSQWGVDYKGISLGNSGPVTIYLFVCCMVRSWGVVTFYKS